MRHKAFLRWTPQMTPAVGALASAEGWEPPESPGGAFQLPEATLEAPPADGAGYGDVVLARRRRGHRRPDGRRPRVRAVVAQPRPPLPRHGCERPLRARGSRGSHLRHRIRRRQALRDALLRP